MPAIADRIDALVRKHPGSNYAMRSAPVAMWTERASGSCRWGSSGGSVRRATPAIIRSIGRGTEKPEPRLAGFYGAGRTVGDVPAADAIERRRQKESPARAWDRNGASASVGKRKVPEVNPFRHRDQWRCPWPILRQPAIGGPVRGLQASGSLISGISFKLTLIFHLGVLASQRPITLGYPAPAIGERRY
jgi:hypothetical protein